MTFIAACKYTGRGAPVQISQVRTGCWFSSRDRGLDFAAKLSFAGLATSAAKIKSPEVVLNLFVSASSSL
jgi:hypothetical protein